MPEWGPLGSVRGALSNERPYRDHRLRALHDSVEGGHHPRNGRMFHAPLHVGDAPAGIALVPGAIELFRRRAELHDEVAGEVLGLGFTPFLPPKADKGGFIAAHDDSGVGAADETAPLSTVIVDDLLHVSNLL